MCEPGIMLCMQPWSDHSKFASGGPALVVSLAQAEVLATFTLTQES